MATALGGQPIDSRAEEQRQLALKFAIGKGIAQLVAAYEPAMDAANATVLRRDWEQVLLPREWLTADLLRDAVGWVLTYCKDERKIPPPAHILQVCKDVDAEQQRTAERESRRALAPPPHEPSSAEGGQPSTGYLAFREAFRERFGRYPDGANCKEAQAAEARETSRRAIVREQAVREYRKTAAGRQFLEPYTYEDLVQAELRHFPDRGGVPALPARLGEGPEADA